MALPLCRSLPLTMAVSLPKAFYRLWFASIASNFADGLLWSAAPIIAVTLNHSTILISILSGTTMLPWLFFAIPIGAVIDRVDRRIAISTANALRCAILALVTFLVETHHMSIFALIASAFAIGTCEVIVDTTAQTSIPKLLSTDELEHGNSRLQISETVLQGFVGGPLGSLLFSLAFALPFAIAGAGYFLATIFLVLIPISLHAGWKAEPRSVEAAENSLLEDVRMGVKFLFNHAVLRRIVLFSSASALVFSASNSTMILFLLNVLHLHKSSFGLLMAVGGIGALLGAFAAPKLSSRFGRNRAMASGITVAGVCTFATGFVRNIPTFIPLMVIESFAITQWNILLMSTYQELIPAHLYGRIHGARRSIIWGLMPIGSVIGGLIATINLRAPWIIGGAGAIAICLLNFNFLASVRERIIESGSSL